jgi:hypothetical protein
MNTILIRRRAWLAWGLSVAAGIASAKPMQCAEALRDTSTRVAADVARDSNGVPAAQAAKARAVVQAQLDAFAADDARRAFMLASPEVRKRFGSPDNFISQVRTGYPVVYRHASVAFLKPLRVAGYLVQGVHMTDAQGVLWLATYHLQAQRNGTLLIGCCDVVASEGRYT